MCMCVFLSICAGGVSTRMYVCVHVFVCVLVCIYACVHMGE
jgi:hypothetical protein